MVKRNSVFAIHFPYLDEISNVPDITNIHKRRELKKATSPIALFVSVKSSKNKPYELKPVAIQINNHEGKMCHECYLIMHKVTTLLLSIILAVSVHHLQIH